MTDFTPVFDYIEKEDLMPFFLIIGRIHDNIIFSSNIKAFYNLDRVIKIRLGEIFRINPKKLRLR